MPVTPTTYDLTNPALFKLTFDRLPNVVYTSQQVALPGVTMGERIQPTPTLDIRRPGDKLTFEPLNLNFLVQEDLGNYIEIFNWMTGLGNPQTTDQYKSFLAAQDNKKYSDAILTILTNKYNPLAKVKFVDCWPVSISPLNYDTTVTVATPIVATVTINYSYYTIEAV
jgi:hypothetical protein